MVTLKNLRLQGLLLLLSLLLPQLSKAQGEVKHTDNSFTDNTKVGINLGLGLTPGILFNKRITKEVSPHIPGFTFKSSPNFRFGVVLGYGFPLNNKWKVGPEMGIHYLKKGLKAHIAGKTSTDQATVKFNGEAEFKEKYLQVPIAFQLSAVDEDSFLKAWRLSLGYEFNVLLSSRFKAEAKAKGSAEVGKVTRDEAWEKDVDLKKEVSDLPKPSGSFLLGSTLDFPKGFYFAAKLKIPSALFKLKELLSEESLSGDYSLEDLDEDNAIEVAKKYIPLARLVPSTVVEFNLGLDIMKLIF